MAKKEKGLSHKLLYSELFFVVDLKMKKETVKLLKKLSREKRGPLPMKAKVIPSKRKKLIEDALKRGESEHS